MTPPPAEPRLASSLQTSIAAAVSSDARIWLVSPAFALAQKEAVPDGSFSNGLVAKTRRALGHVQDIVLSVTDSPRHLGSVAGEYVDAIKSHLPEIIGVTAAFILAEAASTLLAATPTGVGQLAAALIQLILALIAGTAAIEMGVEALRHAEQWLKLAWTAGGDEKKIAEASKEFLRMLVSIAIAALAVAGMRGNVGKGLKITQSLKVELPRVAVSPAMVTSSGALVPGGIGITPGSIATTGPVNIAPSFMTSLGSGGRSAAERARKLKDAGVKGDLGKTEADAARGQAGAEGELQAMERWVRQGTKADDIESLPEIQNGPKNPDFRVKGVLTEVKTRVDPLGESSFIKDKIKEANNQIKKSGLDKDSPMIGVDSKGPQGQVEIQLNGDSAATLSSYKAIEKQVTQSFRPDQSRSLHRVVVHDADGLVGEWVRNPSTGKIDLKSGRGHTP